MQVLVSGEPAHRSERGQEEMEGLLHGKILLLLLTPGLLGPLFPFSLPKGDFFLFSSLSLLITSSAWHMDQG